MPLLAVPADHSVPISTLGGSTTVINQGAATVYYSSRWDVSSSSNEGSLAPGASAVFTLNQYLRASAPTSVMVTNGPPPSTFNVVPTEVKIFGHSYAIGTGATARSYGMAQRFAAMIGAREDNKAVSGSIWLNKFNSMAGQMLQTTSPNAGLPAQPACEVALIITGLNDIANLTLFNNNFAVFRNTMRVAIQRLRSGRVYEDTDASWAWSGFASFPSTTVNSGTAYRRCTATGQTGTISVPADFQGVGSGENPNGEIWIVGTRNDDSTAGLTMTVTVDSVTYGTWDTSVTGAATDGAGAAQPTYFKITGLASGAHTIVCTVTNTPTASSHEGLDYWSTPYGDPPLILVANVARIITYATGTRTGTDADVATLNSILAGVVGEFDSRVVLVDIDSVLQKNSNLFYSDGVHPNDQGHALCANALFAAYQQYAPKVATMSAGRIPSRDVRNTIRILEGTNASMGAATLVAGTVTVSNTRVTANTRIFLTPQDSNTVGIVRVSARVAGTSFTITSSSGTDTGLVAYELIEPGP
jgi:lysophospholipase L1-like esterase